jgi:hypothetical protein
MSAMLVAALFTYLTYALLVPNSIVYVMPQWAFFGLVWVLLTVFGLFAIR